MRPSRYSHAIDLTNWNDSHTLGILAVPPGSRVLDVGAAGGEVARALVERGCLVWGIEIDPVAAAAAQAYCQRLVIGDVQTLDLAEAFREQSFDTILFLDVLEHLADPIGTLRRVTPLLAANGRVIASIPNVAHAAVRLDLLRGRFRYREKGLLDRTHVRFYDRQEVDHLFFEAGLTITQHQRTTQSVTGTEITVNPATFPSAVLAEILADPDALTYQFVVSAAPANGRGSVPSNASDLTDAAVTGDVLALRNLCAFQEARIGQLATELERAQTRASLTETRPDRLRYRVADAVADFVVRAPLVGPIVARLARLLATRLRSYRSHRHGQSKS